MASTKRKTFAREIIDLLKEQQALFAAMGAYAIAIVAALFNWKRIATQWAAVFPGTPVVWLFVFAFAPVLVPVIYVILRRWRTAGLERRLKDIGEQRLSFRPGHFRTAPFGGSEEDREAYTRTDLAHETALDRVRGAAEKGEPFFFLHSQSGCGKTSLLQAYVMPALEKAGWRVIALRGFTGILPELAEALALPETASLDEIRAALAAEAVARHGAGGTLLVVVDQFEEFLILHPAESDRWQAVREWFTELRAAPVPGLLLLLSLRSEYQAFALKLGLHDFDSSRSYVVPLFTVEDARKFLRSGLEDARKKTGELPLDEFIRQMEDRDDTRGMVRPIQANLVGRAYQTFADEFHKCLLAKQRVDFLGDWLQRLLERRELRLHARPIFEGLLQKDGSRCPARVEQIASEAKLDRDVVRHCLSAFESEGLVRCLTPDLADDHQKLWEISHDFLAVQIKRLLSFWHRLWQESLTRAAVPTVLVLWLVGATLFLYQGAEKKRHQQFQSLGFHWDSPEQTVSAIANRRDKIDAAKLSQASRLIAEVQCKSLELSKCTNLYYVDRLRGETSVTNVNLSLCYHLTNISGLNGLTNLLRLNLDGCIRLEIREKLNGLPRLSNLSLRNVWFIDCNALKELDTLTIMDIAFCNSVTNINALRQLKHLRQINVYGLQEALSQELRRTLPDTQIKILSYE